MGTHARGFTAAELCTHDRLTECCSKGTLRLSTVIASAVTQSRVTGGALDCFADARNDVAVTVSCN